MPRARFVCHDVSAVSPAQPRIAAWIGGLLAAGWDVELWSASDPGPWLRELRCDLHVVPDPVLRAYRRWLAPRDGGARADASREDGGGATPTLAARARAALRRIGRSVQDRVLFPDPESPWSARVRRRLVPGIEPGDLVVACSRPESTGAIGALAQRRGAAWWFDFADGWCFQGLRAAAMQPGRRRERERRLERRWVTAADQVSTVNPELAGWFDDLRGRRDVIVYPNVVPLELHAPSRGRGAARDRPCTVLYLGRLSLSDADRSLRPFLDMVARAGDGARVRFLFLGEYTARDRAEIDELATLGHVVERRAPVPRRELAALAAEADATLVVFSPEQRGSSSKLFDGFALELPVFAVVPRASEAAAIVAASGAGEVADIADADAGAVRWRSFLARVARRDYRFDGDRLSPYDARSHVPRLVERCAELVTTAARRRSRP